MSYNKSRIYQAEGITKSERYLNQLARHSFLSLWSYPCIYRDQGDGKEICDLLVVFEKHVLIFSDKYCELPKSDDWETDWIRWVRKTIWKSAKQIWGAERWLKSYPDRIFLDRNCTQKFPLDLPAPDNANYHRIVVAHGASERCREIFGGSGSLMINSRLIGSHHLSRVEDGGQPFTIGQLDTQKGYVHIFDDTTLDIVLNTVDTITDFVMYLSKKEKLIEKGPTTYATGEEDLLAFYLTKLNEGNEHDFIIPPDIDAIMLDESHWEEFKWNPQRKAQLQANEISYLWDALIEAFNIHIVNDTQYYTSHPGVKSSEKIMRFLAREPRTRRRMLAASILELIEQAPVTSKACRVILPSREGDPYYVFLLLPKHLSKSDQEYREVRYKLLEAYCMVTKLEFSSALDIVGIATETGMSPYRSEDAMYLDARHWSPEAEREAKQLQADLGLLSEKIWFHSSTQEYPDIGDN